MKLSPERTLPKPHPAKGHLAVRRITNRQVAKALSLNAVYVNNMLNGRIPTSPRFRAGLSQLLGLPETKLFLPENRNRGVTLSSRVIATVHT